MPIPTLFVIFYHLPSPLSYTEIQIQKDGKNSNIQLKCYSSNVTNFIFFIDKPKNGHFLPINRNSLGTKAAWNGPVDAILTQVQEMLTEKGDPMALPDFADGFDVHVS